MKWHEKSSWNAFIAEVDSNVFLLKSKLFVNNTGGTIRMVNRYADENEYLFVCDDVNLDFGKLRLRDSGSAGGHHGLESVIQEMNNDKFCRLRVGVRNQNMPSDLTGFVLGKFDLTEQKELDKIIQKAALICEAWYSSGFLTAQNKLGQLQNKSEAE